MNAPFHNPGFSYRKIACEECGGSGRRMAFDEGDVECGDCDGQGTWFAECADCSQQAEINDNGLCRGCDLMSLRDAEVSPPPLRNVA